MIHDTDKILPRFVIRWGESIRTLAIGAIVSSPSAQLIVQQLREAGALTADTARPFHAQSRVEELEFRRLLRVGVIREPLPGRYCLDSRGIQPTTLALKITRAGSDWTERGS